MSYDHFNNKHPPQDIQFKIISQSCNTKLPTKKLGQSISSHPPMEHNDSNLFPEFMNGGEMDPSINESIRESIQCSFVSSECDMSLKQELVGSLMDKEGAQRS